MRRASERWVGLVAAASCLAAAPVIAGQPIYLGPYPLVQQVFYDVDYAVSSAAASSVGGVSADTIISIGLPSSVKTTGCAAQVDWFDWDGTPAGLSGPPVNSAGGLITLVPGQTLEFTTSSNGLPNNYPNFQENVFRDKSTPFEGYAQIRVVCTGAAAIKALSVDAEFATQNPSFKTGYPPTIKTKTINVTKPTGIVGY